MHVTTISNLVERGIQSTIDPLNFTIADGGLMCGHNPEQFTFRAKLVATGHRNTSVILSYIQEWLQSKDVININGAILRLNKMCNLSIPSLGADLCDTEPTVTTQPQCDSEIPQPSAPFNLGAIIGGVGAALVLIVISLIAIAAIYRLRCLRETGR